MSTEIEEMKAKIVSLEAERDHYLQAGMAVETKIVENDEAFDAGYEAGIKSQTGASDPAIMYLEEQVRSLTAELAVFRQQHNDMQIYPIDLVAQLRAQVERLTEELKETNAQK